MRQIRIVVERHTAGYVAYPLGLKGVVVGQGDTHEAAVADVESAVRFHIETFGDEVLESGDDVLDASIVSTEVAT